RLQHRDCGESDEVQRIKPRYAPQGKLCRADASLVDGPRIQQAEDESTEHEEKIDGDPAMPVQGREQEEERLPRAIHRKLPRRGIEEEVLPVPRDDGERGQAAE